MADSELVKVARKLPTVIVTSLSRAIDTCIEWKPLAVVSALDPSQAKKTIKMADNHLILDFCDQEIGDYSHPPTPEHIKKFLKFTRSFEWDREDVIVIHCHAGLCRSPALAIGFTLDQMLRNGMTSTDAIPRAFFRVRTQRPQAWPNLRVMTLLDDALELNGELTAFTHKFRSENMGFAV